MFERLKQAIAENNNQEIPDMSNWWALITDIEKLVPVMMLFPKWKRYVKKSARILFCRYVCQDDTISSFKDMASGQLWEIYKWLNDEDDGVFNCLDVVSWFQQNAQEIYEYLPVVKKAKLEADKVRRNRKKTSQDIDIEPPF